MNSQFSNSSFGRILYVAIISLILAATIFVIWYMTTGYKIGTYSPDTRLGSVYIGGLTEEEVAPRLDDRINYWYNDDTIVFELSYQGYIYEFDRNLFLFDTQASIYNVQNGVVNNILVSYQGVDRQIVMDEINELLFLEDIIDNVDVQGLINSVLLDASLMKSFSSKNVEDYLIDESLSIVDLETSGFTIPEGVEIDSMIDKVLDIYPDGKIVIRSKELFDITDELGSALNDSEMSVLSSSMLDLILESNFVINEVHYDPIIDFSRYTVDNYPYYARNSHVNQVVNESFSFYNPNDMDYYFEIEKVDDFTGLMILSGLEFKYDIQINIINNELSYITQGSDDISLLRNGYNGAIVEVERVIFDIYGNKVYDKIVLFEFYPPIKEIIFQP